MGDAPVCKAAHLLRVTHQHSESFPAKAPWPYFLRYELVSFDNKYRILCTGDTLLHCNRYSLWLLAGTLIKVDNFSNNFDDSLSIAQHFGSIRSTEG